MPPSDDPHVIDVRQLNPVVFQVSQPLTPDIPLFIHLIVGGRASAIIDSGLPQSRPLVDALVAQGHASHSPVGYACNTHAHHDHIGNLTYLQQSSSARIVATQESREWLADPSANIRGFALHHPKIIGPEPELMVELEATFDGPISADVLVDTSIVITLGGGIELYGFRVDGHVTSELAWFEKSTRTLVLGDAVTGIDWPIFHGHVNPVTFRDTLSRLREFTVKEDVQLIAMSHYPPHSPQEFLLLLGRVEFYLDEVNKVVLKQLENEPTPIERIWRGVCEEMDKEPEFRSLAMVAGHIDALVASGLVRRTGDDVYQRVPGST